VVQVDDVHTPRWVAGLISPVVDPTLDAGRERGRSLEEGARATVPEPEHGFEADAGDRGDGRAQRPEREGVLDPIVDDRLVAVGEKPVRVLPPAERAVGHLVSEERRARLVELANYLLNREY
jgi:hypothetical protein